MAKSMPRQRPGKSEQAVCTPVVFLRALKARLGIDHFAVDLAASRENTVAPRFYSKASNALLQPWHNHEGWLFCNPPFGDITPWVEKAFEERKLGARTAMLVPAGVGSNWWRDHVHEKSRVLLLNGRLTFVGHKQPYPKDCALLLYASFRDFDKYSKDLTPGYSIWSWQQAKKKAAA